MSIETICIFYELTTNKRIINKLSASEHTLTEVPKPDSGNSPIKELWENNWPHLGLSISTSVGCAF
jgi:hypothetical protein